MQSCEEHQGTPPDQHPDCLPCGRAQWAYFHKECMALRGKIKEGLDDEQLERGMFALSHLYTNLPDIAHQAAGCVMSDGLSGNVVHTMQMVVAEAAGGPVA